MNIVTVRINGVEYNLKGNEKEEYLHRVASYVDKQVKSIIDNNSKLSTSSAAILTAINAVDEMLKKEEKIEQLLDKIKKMEEKEKQLLKNIEDMNGEVTKLNSINEELKKKTQVDNLKELLKDKEVEIEGVIKERDILQETCKKYLEENNILKSEYKECKFQVQSSKYKIMDLQHRLIETQIQLAKEKKQKNPMLKTDTVTKK
ncbi:cell division protein ZapA [Clostridium tetanomorphum]|uniref:Cell division protein ZapA n=1 Tax=Clostridium tetanomorphum TaxID=1553 RepID=A0A923ECN3_CLOTT|nr:cell division protein ZapA [Clostridium tetanomorphum]KAJ50759.1 hypothetical protein CTM_16397 [Clostridium tetanomorphum DSM 665]MBC2399532.1 cell division protein ZapA [Clostridium tetanomorphum]MBP1866557.1 cell division protein ZapA [Clostridium tetanomorphum]NRS85820.1 cell division protein ZapA [Clostridium tetanomorphum]NRZ96172.1 cell division protein ZapA [Clostridium tetanomorphum]